VIPALRLTAQHIARPVRGTPADVVARLGAVQAQDAAATRWAVGIRLEEAVGEDAIEAALDAATIVRTHAMRGTWQLVAPDDVRWLLDLVGPRVIPTIRRWCHKYGLDEPTVGRAVELISDAVSGGHKTRSELAGALDAAGISTEGQRLSLLLQRAEYEAVICSGVRRGKQPTHALLSERAPKARPLPRDEALATLAGRYFRTRGPATVADFAWWSGLTMGEARAGLEAVKGGLVSLAVGGRTLWHADEAPEPVAGSAYLLPAFDEFLLAYKDRDDVLDPTHVKKVNLGGGLLSPCVVVDGVVIGTWRRTLGPATVAVEVSWFGRPSAKVRDDVSAAAARYAAFLGLELTDGG